MRHLFSFLLICLVASTFYAQDAENNWMQSQGTLQGFEVGNTYFTLVTDANVREKPGTQAPVLTKLPIGTPVKIEAVTTDSLTVRGVRMPWLQVSFKENNTTKKGYIWGGFMATASIQTPDEEGYDNRGVLYLAGVAAFDENKHQLTAQIRIAQKGKELAKTEFTTAGDLSYYPSFEVRFGEFDKVKAVLMLNFQYDACGYPSGDNLVFWQNNNQLTKVIETNSVSDGGVFYSVQEYILPHQHGGIADHLIVTSDEAEFEGEDMKRTKHVYKITLYKWAGGKLVKEKGM